MKPRKLLTLLIVIVLILYLSDGIASVRRKTNEAILLEIFGLKGHYSAEKTKVDGPFESGMYAYNEELI